MHNVIGNIVVGTHAVFGFLTRHAAIVGGARTGTYYFVGGFGTAVVFDLSDGFSAVGFGEEVVWGAGGVEGLFGSNDGFGGWDLLAFRIWHGEEILAGAGRDGSPGDGGGCKGGDVC